MKRRPSMRFWKTGVPKTHANVCFPPFPGIQGQAVDLKATNGAKARFGRIADFRQCGVVSVPNRLSRHFGGTVTAGRRDQPVRPDMDLRTLGYEPPAAAFQTQYISMTYLVSL
jgi:hypothetical protein